MFAMVKVPWHRSSLQPVRRRGSLQAAAPWAHAAAEKRLTGVPPSSFAASCMQASHIDTTPLPNIYAIRPYGIDMYMAH